MNTDKKEAAAGETRSSPGSLCGYPWWHLARSGAQPPRLTGCSRPASTSVSQNRTEILTAEWGLTNPGGVRRSPFVSPHSSVQTRRFIDRRRGQHRKSELSGIRIRSRSTPARSDSPCRKQIHRCPPPFPSVLIRVHPWLKIFLAGPHPARSARSAVTAIHPRFTRRHD